MQCGICGNRCLYDSDIIEVVTGEYIWWPYEAPLQDEVRSKWFDIATDMDFCSPECCFKWFEDKKVS